MKTKNFLVALAIFISSFIAQPGAEAFTNSICNSVSCDNPQPSTAFDRFQDRPLDRSPAPSLGPICSVVNDWKVVVITTLVGKILNVNVVYTLIPTLICR
jgi:hypothetical protein